MWRSEQPPRTSIVYSTMKSFYSLLSGYEIHGKENIPRDTGGLIVFHHNLLPYDLLYLMSDYYLERGKPLSCVMHRDMEMLAPGMCKVTRELSRCISLQSKISGRIFLLEQMNSQCSLERSLIGRIGNSGPELFRE